MNPRHKQSATPKANTTILSAFFLSGMAALIYEIVWMRQLTTILSSTIYVVSLLLACFMLGLGLGGKFISILASRIKHPERWYCWAEVFIGLYGLLSIMAFNIVVLLNQSTIIKTATTSPESPYLYFLTKSSLLFGLLIVPTTLMGMTFPIISELYATQDVGTKIGNIYFFNNLGAIVGSLMTGFVLIPFLGIKSSLLIAASLNIIAGLAVCIRLNRPKALPPLVVSVLSYLLLSTTSSYSFSDIIAGRVFGISNGLVSEIEYDKEGMYGDVVVGIQRSKAGAVKRLMINGQGSSSTRFGDMRTSTLLAYLPILLRPEAKDAMVIGLGTGVASGILSLQMTTRTVEIEPRVVEAAGLFDFVNQSVLSSPNHSIVYDDARHYLLKNSQKFDIVVNHPLDPMQSFSSLLFTHEFFEIVKTRLTQGGVYVQWLPIYHLSPDELKEFIHTLHSTFPRLAAFNQMENGIELIITASEGKMDVSTKNMTENFKKLTALDLQILEKLSLNSPEKILGLLEFTDHSSFVRNMPAVDLITDDRPKLEFRTPIHKIEWGGLTNPEVRNLLKALSEEERRSVVDPSVVSE